jgi:protein Mpv17
MHPLLRASLTSGILYSIGDITTQTISLEKGSEIDVNRVAKFALTGSLLHGPYFLYGFRLLDSKFPGASLKRALSKALLGQVFLFPPFVSLLLTFTYLLEGSNMETVRQEFKDKFININVNGLLVWPIANVINFRYIPSHYRVLYVNLIGLGWNTYLSFATH